MDDRQTIKIDYFSDVLCIWAYASQIKIDELHHQFKPQIVINHYYLSLFGNTHQRVGRRWQNRNGYVGYNQHVLEIAMEMEHLDVHPEIWLHDVPATSVNAHLFLKSVQLQENNDENQGHQNGRSLAEEAAWQIRVAFFRDMRNVAMMSTLLEIAEELSIPTGPIIQQIENGEAFAALCLDNKKQDKFHVEGSPTFLLNGGRQRLYGNVGYRILEANIHELLTNPGARATGC